MQHRFITIAVTLVFCAVSTAQVKYTIRSGDTLSHIAKRYGVSSAKLATVNGIRSETRMKIGSTITIPTISVPGSTHTVAKGETDVSIARKYGITGHTLRAANLGTAWNRLQIGTRLTIPGKQSKQSEKSASYVLRLAELTPPAALTVTPNPVRSYTVQKGDNDWKIANRLGIRACDLHAMNAGTSFPDLKPGDTLRVPARGQRVPKDVLSLGELRDEPAEGRLNSNWAMLDADRVGVRAAPSASSARVTLVDKFTKAKVVAKSDNWYCLVFQGGTKGWVRGDMLTALSGPAWSTAPRRTSTWSSAGHLRQYERYARAPRHSYRSRRYWGDSGGSQAIDSSDGVVSTAAQFQGVRYRYGQSSPSGFDCSGLTMYAYKKNGISLPHNAAAQARKGAAVKVDQIKPGDLVFFKSYRGGKRIGHAGIAIGGGKFIHASSGSGRVRVDTYTSGHYMSRFAGARTFRSKAPAKAEKKPEEPKKEAQKPEAADPQ